MRIVIAATDGLSLTNFRGEMIKEWTKRNHEVICFSYEDESKMQEKVKALRAIYYQIPASRTGTNLIEDCKTFFAYIKALKKFKPDIYFGYMSKPIAYGGLAARICGVKHIEVLVSGLEIAFYKTGMKHALVRFVLKKLYKAVHKAAENVFFQNPDDMQRFLEYNIVSKEQSSLVNGSGVDMTHFTKKEMPDVDVVLMVARLVWYKGIREYIDAAKRVKVKYPNVKFLLVGGLDNNAEALSKEELDEHVKNNIIEYCGQAKDVRPYLEQCSIFTLPSYFEGTPRCVLEAMATGRPIITTHAPGCRETVIEGYNGYLVPQKDSQTLYERICALLDDRQLRNTMAENSYELCKEKYDVIKVNKVILEKMKLY